ncbi:MAG: SDR family oxidoreductase, partial [Deltaproteobacteria bacterium]|nr:SDR family oxidoreductase [Deltaproteobacteria bacterium]
AIVTGAARGTGAMVARLFVEEGARVLLADVNEEQGRETAKAFGEAAAFQRLDVSSEDDWTQAVRAAEEQFGGLHVLVNNAGILHMAALEDTSLADYERVIRVNQIGTFLGLRAATPALRAAGGGSIVNVCSVDGVSAKNGEIAYASSKWAVRGLTRVAALELGKWGIRVNAVCPEQGSTEMMAPYVFEGVDPALAQSFTHPFLSYQRERSVEDRIRDIAYMILFLASDESLSCTGADFRVDSGNTAGKKIKGIPGY